MSESKSEMRRRVLDARAGLSPFVLAQHNAELAEWMYRLPVELSPGDPVAAYVATRAEPGGTAMLDALLDRDARVLLPIVPEGRPTRLQWGEYRGEDSLETGRWGLLEPRGYRLDPDVLHQATLILVPAVAVDLTGARLGRGAGYYDRTLTDVDAPVVAVVHDHELLEDGVPHEADDVPMDWVLTPGGGFVKIN